MPRPRRLARRRRLDVTPAERAWALGELTEEHAGYVDVTFFSPPARLREVWQAVRGESFAEWLRGEPQRLHAGSVLVHAAIVGCLSRADVEAIRAGRDPWAHDTREG